MKRYIIYFLICVILLTGCSSGSIIENSTEKEFDNNEEVSDYNEDDIKIIKIHVLLMNRYHLLTSLMDDIKVDSSELLSAVKHGFALEDYETKTIRLDTIRKNQEERKNDIDTYEETDNTLFKLFETFSLENLKYIKDLEEIKESIRNIEKEFSNVYEQIEYHIKSNDMDHIDKYIFHQNNYRDMWEETKILLIENTMGINDFILDY